MDNYSQYIHPDLVRDIGKFYVPIIDRNEDLEVFYANRFVDALLARMTFLSKSDSIRNPDNFTIVKGILLLEDEKKSSARIHFLEFDGFFITDSPSHLYPQNLLSQNVLEENFYPNLDSYKDLEKCFVVIDKIL